MDAGAALRPAEIEIQLGRWVYTIPALPAADWLDAVLDEEGGAIVPGLLDEEDRRLVWRDYVAGEIPREELEEAWKHALAAATGQPWWMAARLILAALAPEAWPTMHGQLILKGIDLERVSVGAFWNAVYLIGRQNCEDDAARSQFEMQVSAPPPQAKREEVAEAFDSGADFLSAMSAFQQLQGGQMPG